MNRYVTDASPRTRYLIYPLGLLNVPLNRMETVLYLLLFDRTRLSARNEGWRDGEGRIWCYYPVRELAARLGCGGTTVKNGLRRLEALDLISRERQGQGKADRIYVRIPEEADTPSCPEADTPSCPVEANAAFFPAEEAVTPYCPGADTPSCPPEGQGSAPRRSPRPDPSKKEREKTIYQKEGSKKAYGSYGNVYLTDGEYASLLREYPDLPVRIGKLSILLHYDHRHFPDHAAQLRKWDCFLGEKAPPGA